MARKRKSEATTLDEVDRTLYSTFCSAANSLSQLYTQAMNHQKVAFQAGERQALEKLYQWIIRQHEEGSRVTAADIVAHIENEIDYGGDEAAMSPRLHFQHQLPQSTAHIPSLITQASSTFLGNFALGAPPRSSQSEPVRNLAFSNALSSPVRRSIIQPHSTQGGVPPSNSAGAQPCSHGCTRSNDLNSLSDVIQSLSPSPADSSMEMH